MKNTSRLSEVFFCHDKNAMTKNDLGSKALILSYGLQSIIQGRLESNLETVANADAMDTDC